MENKKLIEESLPFFKKLNKNDQELLLNNYYVKKLKPNEIFFKSQENCLGLVIVKSGILRAYILSEMGKEITLYRLLEFDTCIMSASCMFNNINFNINFESEEDSELIIIPTKIYDLLKENVYVKEFNFDLVTSRFSEVMWILEQIVFSNMGKRLAQTLIDLCNINNTDELEVTHEKLANELGSAREVITRLLKQFQTQGAVSLKRNKIIINEKKLEQYL